VTTRALVMLVLAALAAPACGSKPRPAAATSNTVEVELVVHSTSETNDGRPLHAVVRAVDSETYVADSYAHVASLVTHKDESVLATFVVFPGHEKRLTIEVGKKAQIAVYALFTRPGKQWMKLIEQPLPSPVRIFLSKRVIAEQRAAAPQAARE
jgi:predicted component of type VI protein secretion system